MLVRETTYSSFSSENNSGYLIPLKTNSTLSLRADWEGDFEFELDMEVTNNQITSLYVYDTRVSNNYNVRYNIPNSQTGWHHYRGVFTQSDKTLKVYVDNSTTPIEVSNSYMIDGKYQLRIAQWISSGGSLGHMFNFKNLRVREI